MSESFWIGLTVGWVVALVAIYAHHFYLMHRMNKR